MEKLLRPDSVDSTAEDSSQREVQFEYSRDLAQVLEQAGISLLVTTYQAGKIALLSSHTEKLALSFHNFDRPMGVAISDDAETLAVAGRNSVWILRNARDVAQQLAPQGGHSSCFLTRRAHFTGEIQAHEMEWVGGELWIVNTLFSCLCKVHDDFSFVPTWQPSFISELKAEDRCHLNGLALEDGAPKYATAMAETDSAGGWRENKSETGCLIDIASSEVVAHGFAMPHSPRVYAGQVWLLDSGRGALVRVDPSNGQWESVARFPGYTRGLAMIGPLAFIGLSKIRETSTFGGVPIAEDRERLKCGVAVVDMRSASLVGQFEFTSGVDEVFDVTALPGRGITTMRGPYSQQDGDSAIWTVPSEAD